MLISAHSPRSKSSPVNGNPSNTASGSTPSTSTPSGKSKSTSTSKPARIASTEGAFNGTGFAVLTENISTEPLLHLFYQNYTGQVQHAVRAPGGTWSGGNSNITTNARAATPLAAINYTSNGNLTVRPHLIWDQPSLLTMAISGASVLRRLGEPIAREDHHR